MDIDKTIKTSAKAVIKKDNKILLVKEIIDGQEIYDLPGGGVEYSESVEEALVREVKEELHIDVSVGKLLGVYHFFEKENKRHVICITYEATWEGGEIDLSHNPADEDIVDVCWFTQEEIVELHEPFSKFFE